MSSLSELWEATEPEPRARRLWHACVPQDRLERTAALTTAVYVVAIVVLLVCTVRP